MSVAEIAFESTGFLTQDEFARWLDARAAWDPNHYELLNGRVVMVPPAKDPHGRVGNRIQYLLAAHVRPARLGEVFDASQGFELPSGDTVEPDHSFVSSDRWTDPARIGPSGFPRVVPDLVVEVLSASTASKDRGEKKAIYERNGVREYWIVDTVAREVTVFVARDGRFDAGTVVGEKDALRSTVLPGLEAHVREVFP